MKKYLLLLILTVLAGTALLAQTVPQGMKYQAAARDAQGNIVANKAISLKINLLASDINGAAVYSEIHNVRTNEMGLFSLVIGEGIQKTGSLADVPWASQEIWLEIGIDEKSGDNFKVISTSRLMSVPYAFHAGTANQLNLDLDGDEKLISGIPFWSVYGNKYVDEENYLGTRIPVPLIVKTNSIERMRIGLDSICFLLPVKMDGSLLIGEDLVVKKNVYLNTESGETINNGDLTVEGVTNIRNTTHVETNQTGFAMTINNPNTDTGDGLQIKLGRTHPAWNGSEYLNVTSPGAEVFDGAINTIRGWILDHDPFQPADLLNLFPASFVAGTACGLVNVVTGSINDGLDLPLDFPETTLLEETEIFGGIDLGALGSIPSLSVPEITIPGFELLPEIPDINCSGLPTFSVPVINFVDVNNSLTNENQFISFVDKDNRELGSVRAESVLDWSANYLDGTYFVNVMASMAGIDLLGGIAGAIAEFTNLADSYNSIGVEYASGHGDYAEWLEREHASEFISAGDIVAVKSGKITKDLTGAEQVMAVSYKPIVLGNAPLKSEEHLGNKIAFMGQIPVKVMGPVESGDYIVAKGNVPGYGIGVNPDDMTVEDFRLTVGRSWDSDSRQGPKMVNTLIGVHNGDYIKILKRYEQRMIDSEARLNDLETKVDLISELIKEQAN